MALVQKSFSEIITFSRASNATRFAPDGVLQYAPHNLLTYSEQFDNAAWTKVAATVTANATAAPDGSVTADKLVENAANAYHYILQTSTTTSNTPLTYSVYAKAAERNFINIQLGGSFTNQGVSVNLTTGQKLEYNSPTATSVTSVGNGWWRISISAATSGISPALLILPCSTLSSNPIYTGDGTSGVFIWGAQLAVGPYPLDYTRTTTAVVYGPRFDYNPTTLAPLGLLIEEQRTNSIRNSTMVGAVAGTPGTLPTNWSLFASNGLTTSVSSTGVSNGINYIDLRISGTSTGTFYVLAFDTTAASASAGQVWTESFWAAIVGGSTSNITTLSVNLRQNGGAGTSFNAVFTPTSILTRYTSTGTLLTSATGVFAALALSFDSGVAIDITLRIGLPQLELGAFATSVIPTATAAVTRSADLASINTLSPWYNAAEGTLYVEGDAGGGNQPCFASIDDTTVNNRIQLRRDTNDTQAALRMVSSGGSINATLTSGSASSINKQAAAFASGDQMAASNGTLFTGITSIAPMPTVTQLNIGAGVGSTLLNGHIRRIAYYNRRLTNAELQVLTS